MKNTLRIIFTPLAALIIMSSAFAATVPVELTPKNMTCKEFTTMNAKAMVPVTGWILNEDTMYKGHDTVDLNEVETTYVPLLIKVCQEKPESKIKQWIERIK